MNTALLVAVLILAGILLFLLVMKLLALIIQRVLRDEVQRRTRGRQVFLNSWTANFFGQESRGRAQVRGNGALVLTSQDLVFVQAYPRRAWEIPLEDVTRATLVRGHLGRAVFGKLLKVEYADEGRADSIAWAVRDPEKWRRGIEAARSGRPAP